MTQKNDGAFSANLLSLQLQLKTLLEEVGGENALQFLDALTNLHSSEQKLVLGVFSKVIGKIACGEQRFATEGDLALKDFEDSLYHDLLNAFHDSRAPKAAVKEKLSLVSGGKREKSAPIDFMQAREERMRGRLAH